MDKLILQGPSGEVELATKVVDDCAKLRPLLSRECMAIFSMLQNKPSYPALIAKELSINEQKAYYYCKQLRNAGLIEIERSEERNGAIAKYYSAPFDSFSLVPANGAMHGLRTLSKGSRDARNPASSLLQDFLRNGVFFAKIVVGSPDPHGPAKARCRDGHLAAGLAAFIGVNCAGFEFPLVFLDTMVGDLRHENSNLVILGGPVTNKIAEQANQFLPIRFSASAGNWIVSSELSGKQYGEEAIGIVEKVPHPYFKGKWILIVAGKRNAGTVSAILAVIKKPALCAKPNVHDGKTIAHVVEGLDVNGDGLIDEVEMRE